MLLMIEGRLSLKLVVVFVSFDVPEFICDIITSFEGFGKVISFDKLSESSALLRVGAIDLILIGGSGRLVKAELLMDNCSLSDGFSGLVNVFKKLLGLKSTAVTVRDVELISSYETYIPLAKTLSYEPTNVSKVLSSYGILVNKISSESLDYAELLNVLGTYVISGLGVVTVTYVLLLRNYAVRASLTVSKKVDILEVNEQVIRKILYELQMLTQVISEELYFKG